MRIVVTGGLGFIGSAVVRRLARTTHEVLNVDHAGYAATTGAVDGAVGQDRYRHVRVDIRDAAAVESVFADFHPDAVIHLAAETHVDRSIDDPEPFVATNVVGTLRMLEAARRTWRGHPDRRFVHVSTDEVFGSLRSDEAPWGPGAAYAPRSPYAATKAAADHLVRAFGETYGLPVIITHGSNTYGPFQFPEKLVPLMILKALNQQELPVYGTGTHVRDWLFVDDHAEALCAVAERGRPGASYLLGGGSERSNLAVVTRICDFLDDRIGPAPRGPRRQLIRFVADRPGHDLRYAMDPRPARAELDLRPFRSFDEGLGATIEWYLENEWWWAPLVQDRYDGRRLGVG